MIQKYEAAQAVPRGRALAALCRALKSSVDWILFGETYVKEAPPAQIGEIEGQYGNSVFPESLLRGTIRALEEILMAQKISLDPDKKAELVITLCNLFLDKPIDPAIIRRLIGLVK